MKANNYPLTLFYDGDCPVCRHEMRALQRRDSARRLRFENVRDIGFEAPAQTTLNAMLTSIHSRTAEGRITAGVETLRLAYRAVGLGWLVAPTTWPLLRGASDRAYLWLARHRFAMPAWLGLAAFGLRSRDGECNDSSCSL